MKLSGLHIAVSSFAVVAGVALLVYLTVAPRPTARQPGNAGVALDPQRQEQTASNAVADDADAVPALATESIELGQDASISAALKDETTKRYSFTSLFDGRADTFVTIENPDKELNILVNFKDGAAHPVTAIEYTPPQSADPQTLAISLDVIVIPGDKLDASGQPVMSFTLQQSLESQTFAIPGRAQGKGLWLRVAGAETADKSTVGDFRILSERLAP